ncbi:MAG: M28 family peptidase [Theionarchaea archaeon]|nr:M28 family peptidase [Theionarchaea archaeon]
MKKMKVVFLAVASLFALFIMYPYQYGPHVTEEVCMEEALRHVEALVAYAPRLAGSGTIDDDVIGGCLSASSYIADTLKRYGYIVEIQEFPITTFQITEYELLVDYDGDLSTPDQINLTDRAIPPVTSVASYDAVVPLHMVEAFAYESTPDEGIVLMYRNNEPAFSPNREKLFSISYEDYLILDQRKTEKSVLYVKFSSNRRDVKGYNIIGIRPGNTRTVLLCAHYDSVFTDGAIDNGSGVAALLECARILSSKQTTATLYFAFFDAEEIGLLGSAAFVEAYPLPQCVCINVDSIASGNVVRVGEIPRYADMWNPEFRTDYYVDRYVSSLASKVLGYSSQRLHLEDVGGISDFVSFSRVGIATTDVAAIDEEATKYPAISEEPSLESGIVWKKGDRTLYFHEDRFGKVIPYIHTGYDDIEHFDQEIFRKATQVVVEAAYQLGGYSDEDIWFFIFRFLGMAAALGCTLWYVKAVTDRGLEEEQGMRNEEENLINEQRT